ncbi:OsmC family protein [bacterium AH-315-F03]|nr:OsmC family protein [bacterium AH-315-F03]
MMTSAKMVWKSGLKFEGVGVYGAPIVTDAGEASGGTNEGYSPVELVLFGLIGCTGIDTVMILKKMRQNITALEIEAHGERSDEYPKLFTKITVKYKYSGEGLDSKRVQSAVKLSQEKYCTVWSTLQSAVALENEIEINGQPLSASNK